MLCKLFVTMLTISAFTFGGGYVIVSIVKKKFVDGLHLLDESEMLDIVSLAQSAPGVMAVNCAVLVGYRLAGVAGAVVCAVATVIPPLIVISVIATVYAFVAENVYVRVIMKGMRAGIAAVILGVAWDMVKASVKKPAHRILNVFVLLVALAVVIGLSVNVTYVVLSAIVVGVAVAVYDLVEDKKHRPPVPLLTAEDIDFEEDKK